VIVGAFAMAISTFLPLDQPTGVFRMVEDNTLIQHGGWMLIALALGAAVWGYRVSQGRSTARWAPIIFCIIAAAYIVFIGSDKSVRTLYPVGPDGNPITTQPGIVANLGIAIYVAGAGVAAALMGSVMLLQSAKQALDASDEDLVDWWASQNGQAQTKKCPDCAETILFDAKVCKHCGYRFDGGASADGKKQPTGKSSTLRCTKCQHVQMVPQNQPVFVCEQCNTKLTRKTKSANSS
jgi:ribosomal protein L37AE/L43A